MNKFFNVGNVVENKHLGIGVVLEVFNNYCKVKFYSLATERKIKKDFLTNLSK